MPSACGLVRTGCAPILPTKDLTGMSKSAVNGRTEKKLGCDPDQ